MGRESVIKRGGFIMMPYTNRMTVAKKSLRHTQPDRSSGERGRRVEEERGDGLSTVHVETRICWMKRNADGGGNAHA